MIFHVTQLVVESCGFFQACKYLCLLISLVYLCQVKELQKQTGVRIKVISSNENTENNEAIILIEESFASGQVSDSIIQCYTVMMLWTLDIKSCVVRTRCPIKTATFTTLAQLSFAFLMIQHSHKVLFFAARPDANS